MMSSIPPYVCEQAIESSRVYNVIRLSKPDLRIAVYPGDKNYRNNYIFNPAWIINTGWCDAMASLYEDAMDQNVELGTADVVLLDEADVILFVDLPSSRAEVEDIRNRFRSAKLVLVARESPVVQPHARIDRNHDLFDLVFLHSVGRYRSPKYKPLPPGCAYIPQAPPQFVPYRHRRFAILVNSNLNTGYYRLSRPWHVFRSFSQIRRSGWSLPFPRFIRVSLGSRYHCRRSFARSLASLGIGDFDIYGAGWEPLRSGWVYRFFPEKPFHNWRGLLKADKLKTLSKYKFSFCYENYEGSEGYISEKIFDALAAGSVPLCLGDSSLKRWLPSGCAVFRCDYQSDKAMLIDLMGWSEERWMAYRNEGQQFLYSDKAKPFLPHAFAEGILGGIKSLFDPQANQVNQVLL